jgi:hypothetical protein
LFSLLEVQERCRISADLMPHLELIAQDVSGWRSVHRCRHCGSSWALEYPFGEGHGGGPPCLYVISTTNPQRWLRESEELTTNIRRRQEDQIFYDGLGEESGPEICRWRDCGHKRIAHSVMCRDHHFEMVWKRKYEPVVATGD